MTALRKPVSPPVSWSVLGDVSISGVIGDHLRARYESTLREPTPLSFVELLRRANECSRPDTLAQVSRQRAKRGPI
jgi:hypothetical protein